MSKGIELIAEERQRQIEKEGYDVNHDNQEPSMEEKIKELIDEYSKRVEREIIGCGLGAYSEDLKREVDDIVQNLFYKTVGTRPSNSDSDEYTEWYKKTLVFGEIVSEFGKRYSRYHEYFNTPKELKNNYGPRD